ncbi:MAG: hypothetical protein R6V05_00220 [Candidatus Brocadiia bacterium]
MLVDIIIAFVVAGACTGILAMWYTPHGARRILGYLSLFLFLFMAVWAGGLWLRPIGPELWGQAWLGFLLTGCVFFLVLAAYFSRLSSVPAEVAAEVAAVGMGVFFYLLNLVFLAAIVTHYTWHQAPG